MNHITSADEPYPSASDLAAATRSFDQGPWQIRARKLPISRAAAIDAMSARVGIPIPEMIFGDNEVALCHRPSGWTIRFTAEAALDQVDKTGRNRLRVAHAGSWANSRDTSTLAGGIADVRPYDWSYSTTYRGSEGVEGREGGGQGAAAPNGVLPNGTTAESEAAESELSAAESEAATEESQLSATAAPSHSSPPRLRPSSIPALPLALLRRRDPILFHDDVILYESELDDNGISMLRVKVRVMPQRLLLLSRLYMRLDHVLARVRDTRVYVDFASNTVLREYTAREADLASVQHRLRMQGLLPDAVIVALRDANQVAELLPVVDHSMESLDLSGLPARDG